MKNYVSQNSLNSILPSISSMCVFSRYSSWNIIGFSVPEYKHNDRLLKYHLMPCFKAIRLITDNY